MCDNPDDERGYAGGYLPSGVVCDHEPHNETIKRGMAKVHAALGDLHKMEVPSNPIYEDLVDRQRRLGPPADMTQSESPDAEPEL